MAGTQPVAVYALKVPPGDIMVPAVPEFAAMFRVSMAAIDPSAAPEYDDVDDKKPPRATLKLIRIPADMLDEDSEDDEDYEDVEDDEDEDESSDEDENGGPSDPKKAKSAKALDIVQAIAKAEDESVDSDEDEELSDEEAAAKAALLKIMKGKGKASGDEESSDIDSEEDPLEMDEVVICTLDPEKHYQQPLDFVVGEDERIFFKVTGAYTVHLTGNYVIPTDDGHGYLHDEEEEDYDLSPDDDELDGLDELLDGADESDDLDDIEDPRIMEVDSEEEEAPKLTKKAGKGKNKRPADDSDEEEPNLDDIMSKSLKSAEPTTNGEPKLSRSQMKKLKKLKKNDGEAAPVAIDGAAPETTKNPEATKKEASAASSEKKVQFAKNLEQGPTPSATTPAKESKKPEAQKNGTLGVKDVQGVKIDDRKLGQGPTAKKGSKLELRYIGKLENGKLFDSNKKGKPFGFKLGAGEVIKGWDIGIAGMTVGGERRLTIPAHLGYGSKGSPPLIPPNSKLIFDVKLLTIK